MKSCDNTDCQGFESDDQLREVEMKEEFEGGIVWWCEDCIKRDHDFVERIIGTQEDLEN
jgi:hypothetical protein